MQRCVPVAPACCGWSSAFHAPLNGARPLVLGPARCRRSPPFASRHALTRAAPSAPESAPRKPRRHRFFRELPGRVCAEREPKATREEQLVAAGLCARMRCCHGPWLSQRAREFSPLVFRVLTKSALAALLPKLGWSPVCAECSRGGLALAQAAGATVRVLERHRRAASPGC